MPGHAAIVAGDWDPPFGSAFPSLGFNGAITFFVPDACLSGSPFSGFVSNSDACSSGGMNLLSAQVGFYNVADPGTILETLVFAPPPVTPNPIFGIYVTFDQLTNQNVVAGLLTDFIGPQQSSLEIAGSRPYFLKFGRTPLPSEPVPGDYALAAMLANPCTDVEANDSCLSNYGTVRFRPVSNTVPEPGSMALVVGALGLGWALRRRAR